MSSERYRPLLAVHVIWHPEYRFGTQLGEALLATLFEDHADLTSHGLRIPVRLWTGTGDGADALPPAEISMTAAEHTVIVALVDDEFLAGNGWSEYLSAMAAAAPSKTVLMLPVALSAHALRLGGPAASYSWIRAYPQPEESRLSFVVNRVVHAVLQSLTDEPLTVFISHARVDGEPLSEQVRDFLHRSTNIDDWFSRHDIPHGSRWADEIQGAASRNLLLAVRSDAYATRQWCRIEVLAAKLAGSPVVVLDALQGGETRSFPYLGNGPVVRWNADQPLAAWERLLTVILLEALRFTYFPIRVNDICRLNDLDPARQVVARPPELVTLLASQSTAADQVGVRSLVYPDPPLGSEELDLIRRLLPGVSPLTPTMLLSEG